MSPSRHSLRKKFMDSETYRYAFAEDFLNTKLALQIHVLRSNRGLKQEELAARIGTKQAGVSRIENANYSSWSIQTLKKVARALGVRLNVGFESFGTLLSEVERLSPESLIVPAFEDDPEFLQEDARTEHPDEQIYTDATEPGIEMDEAGFYPMAAMASDSTGT